MHPGWGSRVRVALAIASAAEPCAWALEQLLVPSWRRSLQALGAEDPPPQTSSALDAFAVSALRCLEDCSSAARFDACEDAQTFEDVVLHKDAGVVDGALDVARVCEANGWSEKPPGWLIGVVLNAVWIARMRKPWDSDCTRVAQTGLDFCRVLLDADGARR
ncbi:MAG TPA: hypothetical protein VK272_01715 [Solirubrobacteraceae bacterium]|nr:hypothetical protein [Solirubrobacteraceae bacterium]